MGGLSDLSLSLKGHRLNKYPRAQLDTDRLVYGTLLTVTVIHDNAQLAFFGLEDLDKGDDVRVTKSFQETRLL